jgi:ferric-dicitrate binding protein FerR (iron transport regulator)
MKVEIDKHALFTFFEGKATLMQRVLIEKWLEEGNWELYYQWVEEWENQNLQLIPNTEAAYQKSRLRIRQLEAGNVYASALKTTSKERYNPFKNSRYRWIAASVAFLLASLLGIWVQRARILTIKYQTGYGEVKSLVLPDGSGVILNANTSLLVPRFGFGKTDREVVLSGEAKFTVLHTQSNQRFIVRTPERLEVEVLGTEFVVFSRKRGSKVVLNKGKVRLWSPDKGLLKPLSIVPGDVVTINPEGTLEIKHQQALGVHQAWEEKRFIFTNTSLREIKAILKENFGITLLVEDSLVANRTFGGTFKVNKPESLLRSLSELLDLQLEAVDASTYQLRQSKSAQSVVE